MLWLVASGARAQWSAHPVGGVPYDVEVPDAGVVAVASSTGAWFFEGGAGSFTTVAGPSGNKVSAYLDAAGCRCGTGQDGVTTCCSVSTPLNSGPGAETVFRVRHTHAGSRYLSYLSDGLTLTFGYTPGPSAPFQSGAEAVFDLTEAVSALRTADGDFGVYAHGVSSCGIQLARNGEPVSPDCPSGLGVFGALRELQLFQAPDGGLTVLLAHNAGMEEVLFLDGGEALASPRHLSSLPAKPISGVAFATGTGDQFADGFGMVVVPEPSGEDAIYGAIPDPSRPAQNWVARTPTQVASVGRLGRVTCLGAKLCGFIADDTATNQLLIYENLNAPRLDVADAGIAEGATSVALRADAGDADGDPVFVRWLPQDAGFPYSITPLSADGVQARLDLPAAMQICGDPLHIPLRATISDGLAGHGSTVDSAVTLFNTQPPAPPQVTGPTRVQAGGPMVSLAATTAAGECPALGGFAWTPVSTVPGAAFSASGVTASFTPPPFLCAPEATARYQVTVSDGLLQSPPQGYDLIVEGWGAPNPAFPPDARVHQDAGTLVTYLADGGHPCEGTAGLPAPTTEWSLTSSTVPGATLVHQGTPVAGPITAPQVGLQVPECAQGEVTLSALQRSTDTGALAAPEATLTVEVTAPLDPVQMATVDLTAQYAPDDFLISGTVDSDLNCAPNRSTQAQLRVLRDAVVISGPSLVPAPGPFQLPVEIGCSGGELELRAQLVEPDGGRSAEVSRPFTAPLLTAAVGEIDGGVLPVSCGAGGQGTITTRFLSGQCPLSQLTWSQQSGPALEGGQLTGTSVSLQTVERGLDGLIGETVVLAVTAEAGLDNTATGTHPVLLVPARPFVSLRHSSQTPIAEEGSGVVLVVEAINQTACPVSGVTLTQQLEGAGYLEGSARLDGQRVEASVVDGALVVPNVSLPPATPRVLTYAVRPRLLGSAAPRGRAFVKGLAISEEAGLEVPIGGCGCASAPGSLLGAGALLLLLARRRRYSP
ncbi:MAG: hypothetical protein M3Y59_18135 [Myxococcota bacterium]|nr:hypothetical protein [Myxococcota bacterium]